MSAFAAQDTRGEVNLFSPDRRTRRRRMTSRAMTGIAAASTLVAVAILGIVIVSVAVKGAAAINLGFLIHSQVPFGEAGGGIANAIVGSAILVGMAGAIAIPVGILVGVCTSQFAGTRAASVVGFALDVLNGVPTIVTGIFVFGVLVVDRGQSGWAGAAALAIVMLPIVARSSHEVLVLVPASLREASLALGVTRWRTVLRVLLPTAAGGLITGALLGVARVAGETAPLLFTSSIFASSITGSPAGALPSIPVRIFELSESPGPAEHAQAWAAALLLIAIVLLLNILARVLYRRSGRGERGAR